jgi:hypothetical protein
MTMKLSSYFITRKQPFFFAVFLAILPMFLSNLSGPILSFYATRSNFPIPVFAYYYIWFEPTSWNRAKIDYPMLGRYASDDIKVMEEHIRWAKHAGIQGFIVSWKSTEKLNWRLEQLIKACEKEDFQLMVVYQGLTFERNPLPIEKVSSDLDFFIKFYASSEAFGPFDKPVIIWNGTWEYSREEIDAVTKSRRGSINILAGEKSEQAYLRVADLVDGNAYYWSSGNPKTFPGYQEKLESMGAAVHKQGGIWIPSAAPGFDGRLVGGTRVVERQDGEMLRMQFTAAMNSTPDLIGLISWNEFSENTHIEPSETFGTKYLEVLGELLKMPELDLPDFDTSDLDPLEPYSEPVRVNTQNEQLILGIGYDRIGAIAVLFVLVFASSLILLLRR